MTKLLDLETLFSLFPPEDTGGVSTIHIDFKSTPLYFCGMWKKLILNHTNFQKKVVKFFKNTNVEFDLEEIREAGRFVAYNRAWFYLNQLDLGKKDHINTIMGYSGGDFHTTLNKGIEHFIKTEEYEKCAHILKILETSQRPSI